MNPLLLAVRKAKLAHWHSYEQLTELLADVEVDIFRPWAYHATWKDTVVAVGTFRRPVSGRAVGWCTTAGPGEYSSGSDVLD